MTQKLKLKNPPFLHFAQWNWIYPCSRRRRTNSPGIRKNETTSRAHSCTQLCNFIHFPTEMICTRENGKDKGIWSKKTMVPYCRSTINCYLLWYFDCLMLSMSISQSFPHSLTHSPFNVILRMSRHRDPIVYLGNTFFPKFSLAHCKLKLFILSF